MLARLRDEFAEYLKGVILFAAPNHFGLEVPPYRYAKVVDAAFSSY